MTLAYLAGIGSALAYGTAALLHNVVANAHVYVGSIIGFLAGLGGSYWIFRVQERDRRRERGETLRRALAGELRTAEFVLNSMVVLSLHGSDISDRDADEVRFFFTETLRWEPEIVDEEGLGAAAKVFQQPGFLSDAATLKRWVKGQRAYQQSVATAVPMPILDAILAEPPTDWGPDLLRRLSYLRWHAYLLATDAERMNEVYRLTFSVGDRDNAEIVRLNHDRTVRSYRVRTRYLLARVRGVLQELG